MQGAEWIEEFEDINNVPAPKYPERERVPEGDHTFTITKSFSVEGGGFKVALAHDDDRYGWVWSEQGSRNKYTKERAVGLLRSLGYTASVWAESDPEVLIGRRVVATITHTPRKEGGVYVNVRSFSPATEAAPPAAPVAAPAWKRARTADQQVKAETREAGDDIPF